MQYTNPFIELCLETPNSIFKGLTLKEKETLIHHHTVITLKRGQLLFKEGDKPRGLICLASGKVKVYKDGVGGRGQILKMVRQPGLIGYRAIYSDNPWSVSAMALEDTSACILERSTFLKLLKKNPDLALKFIKVISNELLYTNKRIVSLTQKHIRGRLAESLLLMRDTFGYEADGSTIRVSMSREDIANLSNMTTSNAIRTLSNLASEGIIGLGGRRICIIDANQLEHICEMG